ncbi:MAG: hypothetical protein JWL65_7038, partial [Gammaproteobacteria bacterium]|nr:hypothetical protein [Gammaproteobacteria bacterium]
MCVSVVDQQPTNVPAYPNIFTVSYCRDCPDLAAKEINRLRKEEQFSRELTRRQSDLLTGVANALRGPPPRLTVWRHYDTPMLAQ